MTQPFQATLDRMTNFNTLWQKAKRTLYVTMRDTYMDCPDRERSQWWGDVVNESGEAFYALDLKGQLLTKKGILELMAFKDQTIPSIPPYPVVIGKRNCRVDVGQCGIFWFLELLFEYRGHGNPQKVYPGVKKYLNVWKLDQNGISLTGSQKTPKQPGIGEIGASMRTKNY